MIRASTLGTFDGNLSGLTHIRNYKFDLSSSIKCKEQQTLEKTGELFNANTRRRAYNKNAA